eukprot:Blabericola_migrator_1__8239@NODE_4269_length_1249_cov_35_010152_g2636_i0_p1_GENE_NODE_4269_length_1249_cov_35_010152_g2636_i0NODE_4269_length_1249_cov_35_010152_g2636_i0_p1_ORF_typecomplete_len186_score33_73DUF5501/PF17605_2/4_8DUF5501/PF17605_2/4_3_NODE_4269_length_1249_cov_35_010152_g2636_i06761233
MLAHRRESLQIIPAVTWEQLFPPSDAPEAHFDLTELRLEPPPAAPVKLPSPVEAPAEMRETYGTKADTIPEPNSETRLDPKSTPRISPMVGSIEMETMNNEEPPEPPPQPLPDPQKLERARRKQTRRATTIMNKQTRATMKLQRRLDFVRAHPGSNTEIAEIDGIDSRYFHLTVVPSLRLAIPSK